MEIKDKNMNTKKNVLVTIDGKRYKMSFKDFIRLNNTRFNYYVSIFKDGNKLGLLKTKLVVDKYNTTISSRIENIKNDTSNFLTSEDIDNILKDRLKND